MANKPVKPPPVFVRLPPADFDRHELESNPLLATRQDFDGVEALHDFIGIESRLRDFRKINKPLALIEIFLLSMKNGVYPPVGVLRLIESAFLEYYKSEGKVSLDQTMGLDKKRGTTPPFKKMLMHHRNDRLFHQMDILIYLGATRDDAATLVAAAMDRDDWNHTMHDMGDLSADTLADLHSRRSLDEPRSEVFKTIAEMNEPGYARAFLKRHFDGLLLPESLRVHVLK